MKTWNRAELGYLAYLRCTTCCGTGVRRESKAELIPCRCALRAAFRSCYERFRLCDERGKYRTQAAFDRTPTGKTNRGTWGRKEEEFQADFVLTARRVLDPWHYRLFRWYFLLGADWRLCARRLGTDRGNVYHAVYRIEERLGYEFASMEPYSLYPPREYFALHFSEPVKAIKPDVGSGSAGSVRTFPRLPQPALKTA